jgi:hypothetical protein
MAEWEEHAKNNKIELDMTLNALYAVLNALRSRSQKRHS